MCSIVYWYGHAPTGKEVAVYCSRHLPSLLATSSHLQAGDYETALVDVFMDCDRVLLTKEAIDEMKEILKEGLEDAASDMR